MACRTVSRPLALVLLVTYVYGGPSPISGVNTQELVGETFSTQLTSNSSMPRLLHLPELPRRPAERHDETHGASYPCSSEGSHPIYGSCHSYYQCVGSSETPGLYSAVLRFCPEGMTFDNEVKSCQFSERGTTRSDCQYIQQPKPRSDISIWRDHPTNPYQRLSRRKRVAAIPLVTSLISFSSASMGLFGGLHKQSGAGLSNDFLNHLERKLVGVDGKLKGIELTVLESQMEDRRHAEIIKNLVMQGAQDNQVNFEEIKRLTNHGILENQIEAAKIQGLIAKQTQTIDNNYSKLQVSLGEVRSFIGEEINNAKSDIKNGFNSVSHQIEQSRIEPLVTKLLITIQEFNRKSNHIESLPDMNRKDAITKSGGYLEYLESNEIQEFLHTIIQQNLAIPKKASDISAIFILELLVHGLQVHSNMMSSIILSNSYLAAKALEKTDLENFNTYMLRVSSSLENIKSVFGIRGVLGLISEVRRVLETVEKLPYASDIIGINDIIREKEVGIEQIEADIVRLVEENEELVEPGTIRGKPSFSTTSVPAPMASWEKGKNVYYAVQHVSEKALSRVGVWSAPYSIGDKANPTIEISTAPKGIARVVYRKFDDEKPELVAVIRNSEQKIFRDIDRDLLNAAARSNEVQAVKEVTILTNNDADVNSFIGNRMTPLHYAAKNGNVKVMEILIAKGADVNAKTSNNEEPLHFAALFGKAEGIIYLVDNGSNINAQTKLLGLSPLHIAVANNHFEATEVLINKGAFINIKDNNGLTPLHMSIIGNGETTEVLLENDNIDVNIVANDGLTPLHYAARSSDGVFVRKLLQNEKVDANPQTTSLLSPLHLAATSNNVASISELINHGVPANIQDASSSTAMHYAAFFGSQEAIMALMQYDQTLPNVTNIEEMTPLDLAVENEKDSVGRLLKGEIPDEILASESVQLNTTMQPSVKRNFKKQIIAANCTTNTVEEMARGSEETCVHIGNVESYVNLVMSMIPLEIYYEGKDEYTDIFSSYDNDLGVAKEHAKIWRNGDSIVQGIRQTFELARCFEPEFSRKYKINQERVETIKANEDQAKLINSTKKEINRLEVQLAEAKEARDQVRLKAVLAYFEKNIGDIKSQIDEKKRILKEDFTLLQELEELVAFLEFVRKDSDEIRAVAMKTKEKIEIFRENLENDIGAFTRNGRVADETLTKLEEEAIEKNRRLEELKRKQDQLEDHIEAGNEKVNQLFEKINESHRELRELRRKLLKKMEKQSILRIIGAILTPVIVGGFLLGYASAEEKKYAKVLQTAVMENKKEVESIMFQINYNRNQVTLFQEMLANSTSLSEETRKDLNHFIILDGDLKNMADKVDTLIQALNKAIAGVKNIQDVFGDVTNKLTNMIEFAKTAKTEAERLNVRFFIYEELSILECNWRDVYIKVLNLDDCTKNFVVAHKCSVCVGEEKRES